jgi:hypothetical protein
MKLNKQTKRELNNLLRNAICERNYTEVKKLLESGADPNFQLSEGEYIDCDDYKYQPYSPLRLLVFIISDCLIGNKELEVDAKVASLLLDFGADAQSAMELAENRYGKFNPEEEETLFSKVVRVVREAC